MADLTNKKQRFAQKSVEIISEAAALYPRLIELRADWFAEGFNDGGANALEDEDIGAPLEYLDAASLQAAISTLDSIRAAFDNGGIIGILRQAKYE